MPHVGSSRAPQHKSTRSVGEVLLEVWHGRGLTDGLAGNALDIADALRGTPLEHPTTRLEQRLAVRPAMDRSRAGSLRDIVTTGSPGYLTCLLCPLESL